MNLTEALRSLAGGNFRVRVPNDRTDEIGLATDAFNRTAAELEHNRDRLVYLTQLASWQVLARKMAHEVKNSLTPIRLTVEEMVARGDRSEGAFLDQAAAIVVDEIESLERRIRAFSEFSSEPPVCPEPLDLHAIVEERIAFLKAAHPEVRYVVEAGGEYAERAGRSGSGEGNSGESAGKRGRCGGGRRADSGESAARWTSRGGDRGARFGSRPERSGAQDAVPADHFVQEAGHGAGAFDRTQECAAFGRRYSADRGRTGRRGFPRAAAGRYDGSSHNDGIAADSGR